MFVGAPVVALSDLDIGELIGKGRFKQVHRGTLADPRQGNALDVVVLRYARVEEQRKELEVLSLLANTPNSCAHTPMIFGTCDDRRDTILLQERAHWGSIKSALQEAEVASGISENHKLHAAAQVARALLFLQGLRIIHADLSCRNLLLFAFDPAVPREILVKVADFGLAVVLGEGADSLTFKQPQATRWCAPEVVAANKMSYRSDVWSLGATLWELFAGGEVPWVGLQKRADVAARLMELALSADAGDQEEVQAGLSESVLQEFPAPAGCSEAAHQTILACLRVTVRLRPSFLELAECLAALAQGDLGEAAGEEPPVALVGTAGGASGADPAAAVEAQPTAALGAGELAARVAAAFGGGDESLAAFVARCSSLRDFLASSQAVELLGEDAALEAFKAFLRSPEARSLQSPLRQASLPNAVGQYVDSCRVSAPARSTSAPAARPAEPLSLQLPPYHYGRGRALGGSGRSLSPAGRLPKVWTVMALVNSGMQRQEFHKADQAFAAFEVAAQPGTPCMLRGPDGEDVAAYSWVVVDHTNTRTGSVAGRRSSSPISQAYASRGGSPALSHPGSALLRPGGSFVPSVPSVPGSIRTAPMSSTPHALVSPQLQQALSVVSPQPTASVAEPVGFVRHQVRTVAAEPVVRAVSHGYPAAADAMQPLAARPVLTSVSLPAGPLLQTAPAGVVTCIGAPMAHAPRPVLISTLPAAAALVRERSMSPVYLREPVSRASGGQAVLRGTESVSRLPSGQVVFLPQQAAVH